MSETIRVAHAVLSLDTGGLERIVIDLIREGRRLDQQVSVVCLERPGALAAQAESLGAKLMCLEKRPGFSFKTGRQLQAVFRELRPDIVHTHQMGALLYTGLATALRSRPLIVHTEHGNHLNSGGRRTLHRLRKSWVWWWAARSARRFFCVSSEIEKEMQSRRVVPHNKLSVVLNGINLEPFQRTVDREAFRQSLQLPAGSPVIGTVGRLSEVKRHDLLLRAFVGVRKRFPNARLLLVGDGPLRSTLGEIAAKLGVSESVCFAGYQTQPDRFLAIMDVFALTSRSEGLPLAILEAWAAGVPVVASSVGGVSDLIDHEHNGLLFPTGDETALTQYLCELLANPTRARVIATAGRREVLERYDAARMAADYDRHYRQLLAVKRGAFSRSRLRRGVTWATPVA